MVALGCLLSSLLGHSLAAEPKPARVATYEEFLQRFSHTLAEGDYAAGAAWVRANPAFAKTFWSLSRDSERKNPTRETDFKLLLQRATSVIADELARSGDKSVLLEAKKLGWHMPDMAGYHPHPRLSIDIPEYIPLSRVGNWSLRTGVVCGQLADSRGMPPALSNARASADRLEQLCRGRKLIMIDNPLAALTFYTEVIPVALEISRGNSLALDDEVLFRFTENPAAPEAYGSDMLNVLRKNGNLSRIEKIIAEGRRRGLAPAGSMRDFIYQTYAADLRFQRDSQMQPEEFFRLHDQAIRVLRSMKDLTIDDLPGGEMEVWFDSLARLTQNPRTAPQAISRISQDLLLLQKAVDRQQPSAGLEPWLQEADSIVSNFKQKRIVLHLSRAYLNAGLPLPAKQALLSGGVRTFYRDAWRQDLEKLDKAWRAARPVAELAALEKLGVKSLPVDIHWQDGEYARLMENWCGMEMQLEEDPAKLAALFAEAEQFGQRARPHLGWMGLDDVRWFYLEHLYRRQPAQWQAEAAPILTSLQSDCDRLAFRPGQARLLAYRAELEKASNPPAATEKLTQAVALIESYLNELSATPVTREKLRQAYQPIYTALAQLQITQGKAESAFETLQRQQQANSLNLNSANLAGDPKAEALLLVRGQGQELEAQYQANAQAGRDNSKTEQLLAKNKAEFHSVLTDLRRQYPNYESALAIRPINFSKSQKFLPADTAVIQYFPTPSTLYIFVVTKDKLVIRQVDCAEKKLSRSVSKLLTEMFKPTQTAHPHYAWDGSDDFVKPLRDLLVELNVYLIAPIEEDLKDIRVLAFIPTGSLHYVPFAALGRAKGAGIEFLVERFPCVNLVKSSDLEQVSRQPTPADGGLLALGNPDGSLPAAEVEVSEIARQFAKAKKLLGKQATSGSLKTLDPGTRYLHLATHGILDSSDPKKSYLLMAGKDAASHLTMGEIYELNLEGIRLVTLSACETAREGTSPGSEISSLAEAFSVAGTNSVVASLWSVSDEATEKLMTEFYKALVQKKSLAGSLQSAELALLKNPATAHPFYWAPFVMLGDWR